MLAQEIVWLDKYLMLLEDSGVATCFLHYCIDYSRIYFILVLLVYVNMRVSKLDPSQKSQHSVHAAYLVDLSYDC